MPGLNFDLIYEAQYTTIERQFEQMTRMPPMLEISPIPAFSDNYIWMIRHPDSRYVAFVDPGEAQRVIKRVEADGLIPLAILITHHHGDHIG
ncbi:MAG: MBL fold metallo-hydrolase, partial [Gammaproteobacteria bacterium]